MKLRHIFGSSGDFTINEEGIIVGEAPKEYSDITRFDVAEYEKWVEEKGIKFKLDKEVDTLDIIVIGYWVGDRYFEADSEYRKFVEEGWPAPIIGNEGLGKALGLTNG